MKITRILIVFLMAAVPSLSAALTSTTTTISSSLNPSIYGQAVTFTATVTSKLGAAPPNGENVTFKNGASVIGTGTLSSGTAVFTISTLSGNTNNVKAVYAGDATLAGSTSTPVDQSVQPASTTTTLVSAQNPVDVKQAAIFTATVTPEFGGTVTGTVGFYNGTSKLGNGTLSGGVATYKLTRSTAVTDPITAVYNGSNAFSTSTSGVVDQIWSNGTYVNSTMTWDGVTRYYQVFLPTGLPANPPMLLMLHGTQVTSSFTPLAVTGLSWNWEPLADQYGFIVVQPASTYDTVSEQWNWNSYFMTPAFQAPAPDDSGFLRQLIINLTAQYGVNPNAVYVAGFSSGAQMAERVGVEISDLVAAIAPTSGQLVGQQGGVPPLNLPGAAVAPIAVQEWAGSNDTNLWPCGYKTTQYSGVTFTLDTVDDTFNYWVAQNSCSTLQTTATLCSGSASNYENDAPTPGMTGNTGNIGTSCANGTEVQFIWEPGIGHSWQSQNNSVRWQFFAANPKPSAK